jgi:hypothetical protein
MSINYWAVGSSFGGGTDNMSEEFLTESYWYDGYAEEGDLRYKPILDTVRVNDILLLKSCATKGPKHSISFTRLKAIGRITEILDFYNYRIDWLDNQDLPQDFDDISYMKTIELMREDDMKLYVVNFLNR